MGKDKVMIVIGKSLRNLLIGQPETRMISPTSAEYLGEIYTFEAVTAEERTGFIQRIFKELKI